MANLVLTSSGETFEINAPTCDIGRENCQITIPDDSLSRNHAQIAQTQNGDFCISDLGSTNGTLLNGKKLKEKTYYKLQNGDELTFGGIIVQFQAENTFNNQSPSIVNTVINNSSSDNTEIASRGSQTVRQTKDTTNIVYAGFWRRFFALFIDGMIIGATYGVLLTVLSLVLKEAGILIAASLNFFIVWLYYAKQPEATLGKKAMGIRVINLEGETISFARATGRYFATWISGFILLIGYLIQPFNKRKQALHDLIVGTIVVKA